MKSKQRLMKTGDNEYSRATGVRAYTLNGGSGCVVSAYDHKRQIPCQAYAYYIFHFKPLDLQFNSQIKIHSTCGATNCVNRDHLVAEYKPNPESRKYINNYLKIDSTEVLAHNLNVSTILLQQYLDTLK